MKSFERKRKRTERRNWKYVECFLFLSSRSNSVSTPVVITNLAAKKSSKQRSVAKKSVKLWSAVVSKKRKLPKKSRFALLHFL